MRGSCETGGIGVRRRRRRLGRVLAPGAVHLVELLGLGVVGLEHAVVDRPGRRDPAVVLELAEVALAQPVQRGAVELRGAADEVVDLRLEGVALGVEPAVGRHVAVVDEDRLRRPSSPSSRGSQSPRSRIRTRLPDGASRWASVPPPAPGADDDRRRSGRSCRSLLGRRWCSVAGRSVVERDVRDVGLAVAPGDALRRRRGLDGGGVVAVEVVPGPGEERVGLAVGAAQQASRARRARPRTRSGPRPRAGACRPRRRRRCGRSSP